MPFETRLHREICRELPVLQNINMNTLMFEGCVYVRSHSAIYIKSFILSIYSYCNLNTETIKAGGNFYQNFARSAYFFCFIFVCVHFVNINESFRSLLYEIYVKWQQIRKHFFLFWLTVLCYAIDLYSNDCRFQWHHLASRFCLR